jgi:hypothetical protein
MSTLSTLLDHTLSFLTYLWRSYLAPFLPPSLASTIEATSSFLGALLLPILYSGDVTQIAALLIILWLSLKTVNYMRRTFFAWVVFVLQMAVVLGVVAFVVYANSVGSEKAVGDLGWVGGVAWGWAAGAWAGVNGQGEGVLGGLGAGAGGKGVGKGWNVSGGGRQQAMGGRQVRGTGWGKWA